MALYLIGDIQGCNAAFQQLLGKMNFSPSRDTLYALGDMVNRGEDSLGVLQTLMSFGDSAQCVLGNHDLHLLAVANGIRPLHKNDTLQHLLAAPQRPVLIEWLRHQRLAIHLSAQDTQLARDWLLVHAGVVPQWSVTDTLALAAQVETALQSKDYVDFLRAIYGNTPAQWSDDLQGADRLRMIINALTRLRFCSEGGVLAFDAKEGASSAPVGYMPWFDASNRKTNTGTTSIAFGHWAALGLFARPSLQAPSLLGLDTGCVWGGKLTAYCLSTSELIQTE